MEQLTLDQAAEKHSAHDKSPVGSRLYIYKNEAFKAGAEWQKEQYKLIKKAMQIVLSCLQNAPDRAYEKETLLNACNQIPD